MKRKKSDQYLKIVEWSKKDGCYVGTAPGLILGGVHGKDEEKVFKQLCQACEEAIKLLEKEGRPLPEPTTNKKYSGKVLLRISPDLHKALVMKALKEGESVNKVISRQLI
jgi:predicted HicB family RNase H-like nuclease